MRGTSYSSAGGEALSHDEKGAHGAPHIAPVFTLLPHIGPDIESRAEKFGSLTYRPGPGFLFYQFESELLQT
jgi:hypothetical protein